MLICFRLVVAHGNRASSRRGSVLAAKESGKRAWGLAAGEHQQRNRHDPSAGLGHVSTVLNDKTP